MLLCQPPNPSVVGFCHDNDAKTSEAIRDAGPNLQKCINSNHVLKSFERKSKHFISNAFRMVLVKNGNGGSSAWSTLRSRNWRAKEIMVEFSLSFYRRSFQLPIPSECLTLEWASDPEAMTALGEFLEKFANYWNERHPCFRANFACPSILWQISMRKTPILGWFSRKVGRRLSFFRRLVVPTGNGPFAACCLYCCFPSEHRAIFWWRICNKWCEMKLGAFMKSKKRSDGNNKKERKRDKESWHELDRSIISSSYSWSLVSV